ncbi:hypothetical protein P2G88_12175 [Aliiglaciecola sp. CAU 1673]|uniref:hypothetical protein n=1 Tax=Aliiglaciecola sp. CAU 1673 TaxID=3032595 RepID=UPI0023DABFA4|nr:hypothetical protein [Aliiglaciecola sp. CAU 1673]MDF2179008.1 hypothetical protein [Aliiglaciecola sp. CAU 1673]
MLALSFFVNDANAQQLSFNKEQTDNSLALSYRWRDADKVEHQIAFNLDKSKIFNQFRNLKSYQPQIAQRYIMVAMQKAAQQVDPRQARVQVRKVGQDVRVEIKGASPLLQQKWEETFRTLRHTAFDDYLATNYYARFQSYLGQEGIKPDHARYSAESAEPLLPAAQALYELLLDNSQPRAYVNLLMGWLQTIPYSPLENRIDSNGAGFLPPSGVLLNNMGDCDSKTTLAVTLLRSMLPNMPLVFIYLPDHALLGLQLPYREQDATIEIEGMRYLLAEPTGPALMPIGEIAATSKAAIQGNMFSYERVSAAQ